MFSPNSLIAPRLVTQAKMQLGRKPAATKKPKQSRLTQWGEKYLLDNAARAREATDMSNDLSYTERASKLLSTAPSGLSLIGGADTSEKVNNAVLPDSAGWARVLSGDGDASDWLGVGLDTAGVATLGAGTAISAGGKGVYGGVKMANAANKANKTTKVSKLDEVLVGKDYAASRAADATKVAKPTKGKPTAAKADVPTKGKPTADKADVPTKGKPYAKTKKVLRNGAVGLAAAGGLGYLLSRMADGEGDMPWIPDLGGGNNGGGGGGYGGGYGGYGGSSGAGGGSGRNGGSDSWRAALSQYNGTYTNKA